MRNNEKGYGEHVKDSNPIGMKNVSSDSTQREKHKKHSSMGTFLLTVTL